MKEKDRTKLTYEYFYLKCKDYFLGSKKILIIALF